jgi:hypothetical protein
VESRLSISIAALYAAYRDLLSQGWREAFYAPKDGTMIEIICLGSIGMFKASWHSFDHQPLDGCGCFFAEDGGNLYPSEIAVWRPINN